MSIGIREARRLARSNAAGIIDGCDLSQLYGDATFSDDDEEVLEQAQQELVEYLHRWAEQKKRGRP